MDRQDIKAELLNEIRAVDAFTKERQADSNKYRDSLLYMKTVTPMALSEEDGIVKVYKDFILEERRPQQFGN